MLKTHSDCTLYSVLFLGIIILIIDLMREGSPIMVGFKALTFTGKKTAKKTLQLLAEYPAEYYWIDNVAVVSRNERGHFKVNRTWVEDKRGKTESSWGAVTRSFISIMTSMATGGRFWGLIYVSQGSVITGLALDVFAAALYRDSSALVLAGEGTTLAEFGSVVEPFGEDIIDKIFDENDLKVLGHIKSDRL
jgi:hypothetical protein